MERPQTEMVRNAQGCGNYSTLGEQTKPRPHSRPGAGTRPRQIRRRSSSKPASSARRKPVKFHAGELDINDGRVRSRRSENNKARAPSTITLILAVRGDFAPNQRIRHQA